MLCDGWWVDPEDALQPEGGVRTFAECWDWYPADPEEGFHLRHVIGWRQHGDFTEMEELSEPADRYGYLPPPSTWPTGPELVLWLLDQVEAVVS